MYLEFTPELQSLTALLIIVLALIGMKCLIRWLNKL